MEKPRYLLSFQRQLCEQVALAESEVHAGANSIGILLIGASGSGKTTAFDVVQARYPPTVLNGQVITPMVRVYVKAKGDAISILADSLEKLGKPPHRPGALKLANLEPDFLDAVRARQTFIFVIEEAHNALLRGSGAFRGQTARWIKNLWNFVPSDSDSSWAQPDAQRGDRRLIMILSGTEELLSFRESDAELRSRFPTIIRAPTLAFDPPELFKEFREIFLVILARFGLAPPPDADSGELSVRAMLACDGQPRLIEDLGRRAATLRRNGSTASSLTDLLASAFESLKLSSRLSGNPFRLSSSELAQQYAEAKRRGPPKPIRPIRGAK